MTPLEALENLIHCKRNSNNCLECNHRQLCTLDRDYEIVKQALEVNRRLKDDLEDLKFDYDEMLRCSEKIYKPCYEAMKILKYNANIKLILGYNTPLSYPYELNVKKYFAEEQAKKIIKALEVLENEN